MLVKIATALVRWVPALALGAMVVGIRAGLLAMLFGCVLLPLTFVCQLAFTGAVIERSGPIAAILDAFRRARLSGFGIVVGLAILISIVEQLPPVDVRVRRERDLPAHADTARVAADSGARDPSISVSVPGGMTMPGRFGSAIPWGAHVVMLLADMPFFAYATVLYTGGALAFADTERRDDGPSG